MKSLSQRQFEILGFIISEIRNNGLPPTIPEIGSAFGMRSPTGVADHLKALEKKGYITRLPKKSRGIVVLRDPADDFTNPLKSLEAVNKSGFEFADIESDPVNMLPVVGTIAAGVPLLADENVEGFLPAASTFFGGRDLFALRVKGDSLIDRHIESGDFVIIRRQDCAKPGEIVAALVDDEATLKIFQPDAEFINLVPANSNLSPIRIPATESYRLLIVGILVGVVRKVGFRFL